MRYIESPGLPLEPTAFPPSDSLDAHALSRGFRGDAAAAADEPPDDLLGIAPPEHSWQGTALVGTLYTAGAGSMLAAVYLFVAMADTFRAGSLLGMAPLAFFPGAVMVWTARMIQQFKLVGLGLGVVCLLAWLLSALLTMGDAKHVAAIGFSGLWAAASVLWMAYLWFRRDDFS